MTKICFVAQFPPPIHGLSKAVDTLYNSRLKDKYAFSKVNITNNKAIFKSLFAIIKSDADVFYFTLSQTKGGNIRDILLLWVMLLKKKKVIVHLHGGYYRKMLDNDISAFQRKLNCKLIKKLDGAIVLGNSLRYIFEGLIEDEKIFEVKNCVDDTYLISRDKFETKMSFVKNKNVKHVLYLSNMIESKGYRHVLRMALAEKTYVENGFNTRFHFDFAGAFFEENEKEFFEGFVKDNKLEEYVTYHGVVSGDAKNDLLENSDIFTLITRYPNEGQPISILEAMGNGMLVVTTDHAGIPDIISDDCGIIVKDEEVNYDNLLSDMNGDNLDKIYNARKIVEEGFLQSCYIDNMDKCFMAVVDGE